MIAKKIFLDDKIFIAGANGMVGSSICRTLRKKGYGEDNLGGKLLIPSREELDLSNKKLVENWFKINKPNIVIIAAAKVGGIYANSSYPTDFLLENLKIQNNVIENAWKNKTRRLLFLGSSCIYPKYADQPIQEESLLKGELEKTNEAYAIAKICGIKLCESLRKQYSFDCISLMPTNLYGPKDNYHIENSHVMAALIRKFVEAKRDKLTSVTCWGTGSPLREFLHVDDLGEAVVFALEKWDPNSHDAPKDKFGNSLLYLNVGTGKDLTIFELANLISKKVGFEGEILWDDSKPNGTPKKQLSTERINKIGWYPKIEIEDGIERTIDDFKKRFFTN